MSPVIESNVARTCTDWPAGTGVFRSAAFVSDSTSLLSGKSRMASGHYRQSFRACTAPEGRPESPATVISANFGLAAAGPGNSEKCRPGAHCEGSARAYRHELRMRDVRMPSPIYRKLELIMPIQRLHGAGD